MQKVIKDIKALARMTGRWDQANILIGQVKNHDFRKVKERYKKLTKRTARFPVDEDEDFYRKLVAELIGWENRDGKGKIAEQIMINLGYISYKLRKERWRRFIENSRRKGKVVDSDDTSNNCATSATDNVMENEISTASAPIKDYATGSVNDHQGIERDPPLYTFGNHVQPDCFSGLPRSYPEDTGGTYDVSGVNKTSCVSPSEDVNAQSQSSSIPGYTGGSNQCFDPPGISYLISDQSSSPVSDLGQRDSSSRSSCVDQANIYNEHDEREMGSDTQQLSRSPSIDLHFIWKGNELVFDYDLNNNSLSSSGENGYGNTTPPINPIIEANLPAQERLNIAIPTGYYTNTWY